MRASISAALDGELSEFESLSLQTHLNGCESCRAFEASAQLSTTALRAAPLEPLSRPLTLPSRRRSIAVPLRVPTAAAAAAVLMIVVGGLFESLHGGAAIRGTRPSTAGSDISAVAFNNLLDVQAIARRQQQANLDQLVVRRAQFQSNRIPRHPGFQNP
jgi:predicted anti-sigma-YlaC factor YlaD